LEQAPFWLEWFY